MDQKPPTTLIFQSAKLGDINWIIKELDWAEGLINEKLKIGRVFGVSGGNLAALAFGLSLAARNQPKTWGKLHNAIPDFRAYLRGAKSRKIRAPKINPLYGFHDLKPLREWVGKYLCTNTGREDWYISDLGIPLYLCTLDCDAIFRMYGPEDDRLQSDYGFIHISPPRDALLMDALTAGLSTLLSTSPTLVNGEWRFDCRPAIVDAGAIVADLQAADPRPIMRTCPYTSLRKWNINWFTSSFIMHSAHERNHSLLSCLFLDLKERHSILQTLVKTASGPNIPDKIISPCVGHVDLPYIGSTEAATNMRQSVKNRCELTARFKEILKGQMDSFPFDQSANVIYGAGGFSGILAGMITTRAVDDGFARGGGDIRQVYGISAGVLNGFFHAVQLAAVRYPDLYTPLARHALDDLDHLLAHASREKFAAFNLNPIKFWKGWGNLNPLEGFLLERLAAYTGSKYPADITFDDIALPLTVSASREDGYPEYLGMTQPNRAFQWEGRMWKVISAPVVRSVLAGWSMNTYILPTVIHGQEYTDGGGTFYDQGLMAACFDSELTNLLNIHLDEPEGNSYNLPPRMNLLRVLFETHNLCFPEERRRMRAITDLLFDHFKLRQKAMSLEIPLPPDFRKNWVIEHSKAFEL